MELILTEDIPNLGSLGDTVTVKSGFGRNFLIPKGMALLAKGKESKELRHRLEYIKKLREGKIEDAKELANKLKDLTLEVERKAGPEGKLFGSVNNRDLNELLKEKKFDFGRRSIILNSPIRNVGVHEFTVRIHSEVSQSLKVKVIGDTEKTNASEKLDQRQEKIKVADSDVKDETDDSKEVEDLKLEQAAEKKKKSKNKNNRAEVEDLKLELGAKEGKDSDVNKISGKKLELDKEKRSKKANLDQEREEIQQVQKKNKITKKKEEND